MTFFSRSFTRQWASATVAGLLALGAAACGQASATTAGQPVVQVPLDVIPASLDPGLTSSEFGGARAKFIASGSQSLVSRGELWQIRQGKVLVAALQISTLKPRVDLTIDKERSSILGQVLPGAYETIRVDGVTVAAAQTTSEVFYMWFGPHLFEVLQITKTGKTALPFEEVLAQIVQYQRSSHSLGILVTTTTTTT